MVEAPDQHIGQHVEPADQIELLEDHGAAGPPGGERRAAQAGDVDVVETDGARTRLLEPVDHAQKRRLAGPRTANDADEPAGLDRQRHIVDRGFRAESARETFNGQHERALLENA
jgi:hypothetical protein